MSIEADILIEDPSWDIEENVLQAILTVVFEKVGFKGDNPELCFVFTNDNKIQHLNKTHRGKDKPTNVLSFPSGETGFLGDVILAYETLQREAREQDKSFDHHLAHLIAHGVLHLLGYDHENDAEAEAMEALEVEILAALDVPNPYESA